MRKKLLQFVFPIMVILLLVLAGCEDEEKDKALAEAQQARMSLTKVQAQLARAETEITDLNEALETVRQDRDQLALQVKELSQDGGRTSASYQQAQEMVKSLNARSSEQSANTAALEKRIDDLAILVESQERTITEQNATIDDLLKTIDLLQNSGEDHQDDSQGQVDDNDQG